VLFSLAVIELAKPGLESTTYELLVSVSNASGTLSNVVSTQLLNVFHASGCTEDNCDNKKSVDLKSTRAYEHSGGPRRFTYYTLLIGERVRNRCEYISTCLHTLWRLLSVMPPTIILPVLLLCCFLILNLIVYLSLIFLPPSLSPFLLRAVGIGIVSTLTFTNYLPRGKEHCHEIQADGDKYPQYKTARGVISLVLSVIITLYGIVAVCLLLDSRTSCLEIVGGTGC